LPAFLINDRLPSRAEACGQVKIHLRKITGLLAIYAIALHTILWGGVMAPAATGAHDPFTIICHADGGDASSRPSTNDGHSVPAHACDHCNLCSAAGGPAAPDAALLSQPTPSRLLLVLRPINPPLRDEIAISPHLARGPPAIG